MGNFFKVEARFYIKKPAPDAEYVCSDNVYGDITREEYENWKKFKKHPTGCPPGSSSRVRYATDEEMIKEGYIPI